jgi:hypothetical protein
VPGLSVREHEVAAIRVVLRSSSQSLLEALDDLLPSGDGGEPRGQDCEHVELREGPTMLRFNGISMDVVVAEGELPAALRGILGSALDRRGGALLHGAGIVVDGKAVLCIAPSEGGKTTLCGKIAGRAPILSDETVALRLDDNLPRLAGTLFWSGLSLPTAGGLFPLAAICFLRKGPEALLPLPQPQALSELLLEWHLPERPEASADALARASTLVAQLPLFTLRTTLEGDPLPLLQRAAAAGRHRAV